MPQLFQRQEDDEGNVTYVEVTEVPDDVIRETPTFKKIVDESIKRRQQIKDLKGKIEELSADETPEKPEPVQTQVQQVDPDALVADILQRLDARNQEREQQTQTRRTQIEKLIADHKLSADAYSILDKSQNPDETAAYMGRLQVQFDSSAGGETPVVTVNDAVAQALKSLGLDD